jgi:hypothetical protein
MENVRRVQLRFPLCYPLRLLSTVYITQQQSRIKTNFPFPDSFPPHFFSKFSVEIFGGEPGHGVCLSAWPWRDGRYPDKSSPGLGGWVPSPASSACFSGIGEKRIPVPGEKVMSPKFRSAVHSGGKPDGTENDMREGALFYSGENHPSKGSYKNFRFCPPFS